MELAVGIGYFVVLLATMVVVYGFIKLIPYVLAVSATFVLFQWVFTSLALPSAGPEHWYQGIGAIILVICLGIAVWEDLHQIKQRSKQIVEEI